MNCEEEQNNHIEKESESKKVTTDKKHIRHVLVESQRVKKLKKYQLLSRFDRF